MTISWGKYIELWKFGFLQNSKKAKCPRNNRPVGVGVAYLHHPRGHCPKSRCPRGARRYDTSFYTDGLKIISDDNWHQFYGNMIFVGDSLKNVAEDKSSPKISVQKG